MYLIGMYFQAFVTCLIIKINLSIINHGNYKNMIGLYTYKTKTHGVVTLCNSGELLGIHCKKII